MAGRKKTETVEAEVVETAVVPAGKMEFRLINPTEDGFLRRIDDGGDTVYTSYSIAFWSLLCIE